MKVMIVTYGPNLHNARVLDAEIGVSVPDTRVSFFLRAGEDNGVAIIEHKDPTTNLWNPELSEKIKVEILGEAGTKRVDSWGTDTMPQAPVEDGLKDPAPPVVMVAEAPKAPEPGDA